MGLILTLRYTYMGLVLTLAHKEYLQRDVILLKLKPLEGLTSQVNVNCPSGWLSKLGSLLGSLL